MSALDEPPLRSLLDDARAAEIEVDVARGARSLRELDRIHGMVRGTRVRGVLAAMSRIDPITATVQLTVAEAAVDAVASPGLFHADLRPNRVRLLVHDGRVVDAVQA